MAADRGLLVIEARSSGQTRGGPDSMQVCRMDFLRGASEIFTELGVPRWSSVCGSDDLGPHRQGGHWRGAG